MVDVKTSSSGWNNMKNSVGTLIGKGAWGKGVIDELKSITAILEDAEDAIQKKDSDGVVSFQHTDYKNKYQELFNKIEVLYDYSKEAHNLVEEHIDDPFHKDFDKFVESMRDLSINNYSTSNTIGATTLEVTSTDGYNYETREVKKKTISVDELFADETILGKQMKEDFQNYKSQFKGKSDEKLDYSQYKLAMLNTGAFQYTSIRDQQLEKEMWVNIGLAVTVIAVSIVCPPAGAALGIVLASAELASAATGKDWISGRELDSGERWTRGLLAGVSIALDTSVLRTFSQMTREANAMKYALKGGANSLDHMGDMVNSAKALANNRWGGFVQSVKSLPSKVGQQVDNLTSFASSQTSKVTNFVKGKTSDALTGLKEAFADGKTFVNRANNNIKQIILPQGDLALPGGGRLSGGTHYLDEVADTGKNVSKIVGEGAKKASEATRPQTMEEFLKEMDELPRARLSKKVEDGLVSTPKGERFDPSVYMSKSEIETHLSLFDDGAVKIQSKEEFNKGLQNYGGSVGHPKTGTYVLPKNVADKAISVADGDPRILEKLLGLDPGYLGENPVLLDINKLDGLRVPSGNEAGAWQGMWEPGGFTNAGIPEAVINQLPSDGYKVMDVFK